MEAGHRIRRIASGCLFAVLVSAFMALASAAPLCTANNMAVYQGTSCQIGNFLFTFGSSAYIYTPDLTPALAGDVHQNIHVAE